MNEIITDKAPAPVGPYSQAVKAGSTIYCSGQVGLDTQTMELVSEDISEQTNQALRNLECVLVAAGASKEHIVKVDVFLTDMENFALVNAVYAKFFTTRPYPARTTVAVKSLPKHAQVEIACIAQLS